MFPFHFLSEIVNQVRWLLPHLFLQPSRQRIWFWENEVTDENASAFLQCWDETAQDLYALLIGPVVEDQAEEVGVGVLDWLRFEEVVLHEFNPTLVFRCCCCQSVLSIFDLFRREILDDEFTDGRIFGDLDRRVAAGTTDLGFKVSLASYSDGMMLRALIRRRTCQMTRDSSHTPAQGLLRCKVRHC